MLRMALLTSGESGKHDIIENLLVRSRFSLKVSGLRDGTKNV